MKKAMITFGILVLTVGQTMAQNYGAVSKTTFNAAINTLSAAIDKKSLTQQNAAIQNLENLMDSQVKFIARGSRGANPIVESDQKIENYVKGLPANIIITDKATLMSQLKQFAATCQ
jgi:hypothetical protein